MQENFAPHFPLLQRPLVVGYALAFYVVRFVFPYGLSAIIPIRSTPARADHSICRSGHRRGSRIRVDLMVRYPSIAGIGGSRLRASAFSTTFAMVLQFLPVGRAIVAERYTDAPDWSIIDRGPAGGHVWRSGVGRSSRMPYLPAAILAITLIIFTGVRPCSASPCGRIVSASSPTCFQNTRKMDLTHYNRGLTNFYHKNYKASITDYDV